MRATRCSPHISIVRGEMGESIFLFTFSEGENLYLVPGFGITEMSVAQFKLSFNKAYDVRIWFHSIIRLTQGGSNSSLEPGTIFFSRKIISPGSILLKNSSMKRCQFRKPNSK